MRPSGIKTFGLIAVFSFAVILTAFAQGINIPSGSSLLVNSGTFRSPGDVTLNGSLAVTTGEVSLYGDWNENGSFSAGTGTVDFTGVTGTQTIITDEPFFNLGHSGSTPVETTVDLDINGSFVNLGGTLFLTNDFDMTVAGDWSNFSDDTFVAGTATVVFDGTSQSISGTTTFYNFEKEVLLADAMTFDADGEQTITNSLTMQGTVGQLLTLQSDSPPNMWEITLVPGGLQTFSYLRVGDSDASGGLLLVAGTTSVEDPVASTINWSFGAATLVWEGDSIIDPNDWDDPTNWDLGFVPTSVDTAVIPGTVPAFPELDAVAADVEVANLEIQTGANVSLLGESFTINGTLENDGIIFVQGDEPVVFIANPDTTSGTFVFTGNSIGGSEPFVIPPLDYYNIQINDPDGGTADTFLTNIDITVFGSLVVTASEFDISTNPDDTLTIFGTLLIEGGTFTGTSGNLDLNGGFNIESGTFIAPDSSHTFNIAGDFIQSGGTFTNSSGTVNFDGTFQFISAELTEFATFLKTTTVNATLVFDSSILQANRPTYSDNLTLTGTVGAILYIQSDVPGVEAFMSLDFGGTQDIQYVEVRDNNADLGVTLIARNSSEPNNNNTNWNFGGATFIWEGDSIIDPTNWDDPSNWDLGLVPAAGDTAIIPITGSDPILVTDVAIGALTVNSGATVTFDGNDFSTSGTLSLDGTITLIGNEAVSFGIFDTDSGTFEYIGTGTGAAQTITDFGAIDYFNVTINGTGPTSDTFVTLAGTLTVAGTAYVQTGELDISANTSVLVVNGSLSVNGTLTADNAFIDVNGDVIILSSGIFSAPDTANSFFVSGNWTMTVGGTFLHNNSEVTFDNAATSTTIRGDTFFFDFTSTTLNKTFYFEDGSNQTIEDDMTLLGSFGNEIFFRSIGGGAFSQTFPGGAQFVQFVNVEDAIAVTNVVNCFNCTDFDPGSTVNWIFATLAILVPGTGETTDLTPTIIGVAAPGATVRVEDETLTTIGTVVADANGNFRFEVDPADALSVGVHTLTPWVGLGFGASVTITTVVAPTTAEQPTITSHSDGDTIVGSTPTFEGFGAPNELVEILASDGNGNLLLTVVGTGMTDGSGFYSIQVSTALVGGDVFISVTVSNVASDILIVQFTDPFGVVFDSITNDPLENAEVTIFNATTGLPAVPGVEIDASDPNPFITAADGLYGFLTVNGTYYITITLPTYVYPSQLNTFDPGRVIVSGSKGENFITTGSINQIDQPMDPSPDFLRIEKDANKKEVRIGEVVTYTVTIENLSVNDALDVQIQDKIPPGFKYLAGRVQLDDVTIDEPNGSRPLNFTIGTITAGQTRVLRYQLVVGSGVTVGTYENKAFAIHGPSGIIMSNTATEAVKVVLDPLFDLGTVIGKVFYDRNENGLQDEPQYFLEEDTMITEDPVPNVRIVMEDGTVITTDNEGKFSVPAVLPGRHVLRLDERTLPDGSYLTTDKAVIVDVTAGLMVKVNFGVNVDLEAMNSEDVRYFANQVNILQDAKEAQPRLNVSLFTDEIGVFNGIFVEMAEFRVFTNYPLFIAEWSLEIVDKDTNEIVKLFNGTPSDIFDPILWDGKDKNGEHISLDKNYVFRVTVDDKDGQYNETKPKEIHFKVLEDDLAHYQFKKDMEEKRKTYADWVEKESELDSTLVSNMVIKGEVLVVDPMRSKLQFVRIMQAGDLKLEVPVVERQGLTAKELIEGAKVDGDLKRRKLEIILPQGEYQLIAQEEDADVIIEEGRGERVLQGAGESVEIVGTPIKTYKKDLKVGEDYLFFVGLGDAKAGYNFYEGSLEPVKADEFKKGFYVDGKAAYYLKGKVLGKYIITSSFDSDRDKKELFRNIDQDKYYPVYGDESQIDYQATDTQGKLYLLIEWDKSSVLWGNYSVGFGDTEFSNFTRTLYGGKVAFETVATTPYGEPRTKIIAFRSRAQQKSAHVEYAATGGSIYYAKHKDVIEGSDKVRIEVRDKITGLVTTQRELTEGADYEMDYEDGRVLFWQPIPMLIDTYSIISSNLLDGNLVYVVMDYEYEVKDKVDEAAVGTRVRQALTDEIIVGATYVKEGTEAQDYILKGTDVTLQVGPDAKVVAEYAETESEAQGAFVSTDGGLSFTELATSTDAKGKAYGLKGDARLFNRLGLSSYYKWVDSDFSTSATTAQQGKESYGIQSILDITDATRLTARYDIQELIDDGNLQTLTQVGGQKSVTTLVQLVHELRKVRLTAEYRKQELDEVVSEEIVAARIDYRLNERLAVFAETQRAIIGENLNATTLGLEVKPWDKLTISVAQTVGENDTATRFAARYDVTDRLSLVGEYAMLRDAAGKETTSGSAGVVAKVLPGVEIKTTMGLDPDGKTTAGFDILGTATVDIAEGVTVSSNTKLSEVEGENVMTTNVAATKEITDDTDLKGETIMTTQAGENVMSNKVSAVTEKELTENTKFITELGVQDTAGVRSGVGSIGTSIDFDDGQLTSTLGMSNEIGGRATTLKLGGTKQVDETTTSETALEIRDMPAEGRDTTFSFGSKKNLTDTLQLVTSRTFGTTPEGETTEQKYSLIREKDGKMIEGYLARKYNQTDTDFGNTNIFGLTGQIDDRWAMTATYEKGEIANLDGTHAERDVVALNVGYVKTDPLTGKQFKSSTKVEYRIDDGQEDKKQYLLYNATEGNVTPELSLFGKVEISQTMNEATDTVEAEHKELSLGGAYRPIAYDQLNLLARYTYQENKGSSGQEDFAGIEEEKAHVIALDAIYDINESWQITEKFAFRMADEKVTGFDFTKTHTWLMIHRLKYNIDKDWSLAGEFRQLVQTEAQDVKRGFLIEASRSIAEYAQLGVGYNFTDFNDDLTNLDYTTQGPFIRITGSLYDRSPQEIARQKQQWKEEKIKYWAWKMVNDELMRTDSPILQELNGYFLLADTALEKGETEKAREVYRDVVMAGRMMFEEAAEYIRGRMEHEEELDGLKELADQYFKNRQYRKAKEILQKIVEDVQNPVLE